MGEVGIRALKQNASEVVASVTAGEPVTITDRGRPVAVLSALADTALARLVAEGRARRPLRAKPDIPPPLRGRSVSGEIAAMRDAERH